MREFTHTGGGRGGNLEKVVPLSSIPAEDFQSAATELELKATVPEKIWKELPKEPIERY